MRKSIAIEFRTASRTLIDDGQANCTVHTNNIGEEWKGEIEKPCEKYFWIIFIGIRFV